MNKEYIINEDKVFVTDENGKIIVRDNTNIIEEELMMENYIECLETKQEEAHKELPRIKTLLPILLALTALMDGAIISAFINKDDIFLKMVIGAIAAGTTLINLVIVKDYIKNIHKYKNEIKILPNEIKKHKAKLKELSDKKESTTISNKKTIVSKNSSIAINNDYIMQETDENIRNQIQNSSVKRKILRLGVSKIK